MIKLNRKRIIILSIVLSIIIVGLPIWLSRNVRSIASRIVEPLSSVVGNAWEGLRVRLTAFGKGSEIQVKLSEEEARRVGLEARLARANSEMERIKKALNGEKELGVALQRARWRGDRIRANVIRRPAKWESYQITVDRGTASGVKKGCAVFSGEAVLGVVASAEAESSRVLVLGHPRIAVPAKLSRTGQQGLVAASGGVLKLEYVVRDQARRPLRGHRIVTSGLSGVFPRDCLVGFVGAGVSAAEGQPFYDIDVEMAPGAIDSEMVWILVSKTKPGIPGR
jgi:rod shape-determining protein MreC